MLPPRFTYRELQRQQEQRARAEQLEERMYLTFAALLVLVMFVAIVRGA